MKKFLFIALMAVMSIGASAQIEKGLRWGAQASIGLNSIGAEESKSAFSYGVGVIGNYTVSEKFLLLSGKSIRCYFVNFIYRTAGLHNG